MSVFSFLKDVGQKLFHHDDKPQAQSQNQAQNQAPDQTQDMAQKLQQQIEKLNLGIDSPKVTVQGDKAIIEGKAMSQEALEKAVLAVGNTMGIAQVESRVEAPATATAPRFYTVKPGDNLSKISKEVYGNANRYNEIFEANKPMLKDPDEIYPGQQLRIPGETDKIAA